MPAADDLSGCPAGFDATGKSDWKKTRNFLVGEGRWRAGDSHLLERYVRALMRARHANEVFEGQRNTPAGGRALEVARKAERDAQDYATALLLTPASRAKADAPAAKRESGKFGFKPELVA